ncbi:MAG: hypothetical protein M1828_004162 [Chrysothrix sp. TS-e1954]|nr:MAG: hypothetical protein M1828_004162 [Chrysothrix sp. TS-e1954]
MSTRDDGLSNVDLTQYHPNKQKMLKGEMYFAFEDPFMITDRAITSEALMRFNDYRGSSRRERTRLWRELARDKRPMPPELPNVESDEAQFDATDPWVQAPLFCDYGYHPHLQFAPTAFINMNCHFVDTCPIVIGPRTLVGPSCHFYSGTHPLDPVLRNGLHGPESGAAIVIGKDCWIAGRVTILAGVTIGDGAVVGAGSIVTRSVESMTLVVGNPARFVRRIERGEVTGGQKVRSDA